MIKTRLLGVIFRRFFMTRIKSCQLTKFGDLDSWYLASDILNSNSIIISGGVGTSISFETSIANNIGGEIYLFDPSPTALHTISEISEMPDNIIFHPIGLAGSSGSIGFGRPDRENEGSYKVGDDILFECVTLSSFVEKHKIGAIDLIKLDVEGFEYDILSDILGSKIFFKQLCVEFHWSNQIDIKQGIFDILVSLMKLYYHGYRCVSLVKSDFTFIHRSFLQ